MEKQTKFPYQFFVVTFTLVMVDLAATGFGRCRYIAAGKRPSECSEHTSDYPGCLWPGSRSLLLPQNITRERCRSRIPARSVGSAFWLEGVADSHPGIGWKHLVGVGAAGTMGRAAPENAFALRLGFSAVYFDHDLFRRRTGRTGLARVYFGPDGRATGSVVGEPGAGGGLGFLAFAVIFYSGSQPDFYAFCRIYAAYYRLFLVLRLGAPGFWKTHHGRFGYPRLGQRICSPVSYVGDGRGGRAAALLDLGEPYICDWPGNDDYTFTSVFAKQPEYGAGPDRARDLIQGLRQLSLAHPKPLPERFF